MTMTTARPDRMAAPTTLGFADAVDHQGTELTRTLELLGTLSPLQWAAPVAECPGWDVRTMYLHVLGACESGASIRENTRQLLAALKRRRRDGGTLEAALSATQIAARAELRPAEIVDRLAKVAPRMVRGRRRLPRPMRSLVQMKVDGPVVERWSLGYLTSTIYLRDLWMHRIDASRATGCDLVVTAGHDGRIVADVADEWARRHGRPFTLRLSGPSGLTWENRAGQPADAETVELDAIEFCRTLSGRAPGAGLMTTIVPF